MTGRSVVTAFFTLFIVLAMFVSPVAMAAGGIGASSEDPTDAILEVEPDEIKTQSGDDVMVAPELTEEADETDTVEVFVRLDAAESEFYDLQSDRSPTGDSQAALEAKAELSQAPLEAFADRTTGVEVMNDFWITNAVLLKLDTERVDVEVLAQVDGVVELHPNYEVELIDPVPVPLDDVPADHGTYTYGLEQINVPEVWDEFDATGEDVRVAVLDTGIDADHPEFPDYDSDNWAEFAFDGSAIDSQPYDLHGHGTHVSGTVLGDGVNETFGHIGVAPDAELYAINVFPGIPDGIASTSLAAIVAGMQHAVDVDADVMNLSLGGGGFAGIYVDVIKNAKAAGTHVVSSSGNAGPGSDGTPANVYNGTAVGASDVDRQIAAFSTGTVVDTDERWGFMAPDTWPETYATPDVAAPGVAVLSAVPGGEYEEWQGTSMAAPHVTGAVALMMSADDDLEPGEAKRLLEDTANKPPFDHISDDVLGDAFSVYGDVDATLVNLTQEDVRDVRYGTGIVDVYAAFAELDENSSTIGGEVVDPDGAPIDAVVTIDDADRTTDNFDVADWVQPYEFDVVAGEHTITADGIFGFGVNETTVTVGENEVVDDADIVLDPILDVDVGDQPFEVADNDSFVISHDVANVEEYTIALHDNASVAEANLTVSLFNESDAPIALDIALNEPVAIPAGTEELRVDVHVIDETDEQVQFDHTFEGLDETIEVETSPTTVLFEGAEPGELTIVDADLTDEADFRNAIHGGNITIENTGDFTEVGFVDHQFFGGAVQGLIEQVVLEGGETMVFEVGPYIQSWAALGSPGDVVDQHILLHHDDDYEHETSDVLVLGAGTISGTVTDVDTGEPLGGIVVTATDGFDTFVTITDSDGQYLLDPAWDGTYTVTADAPSFGETTETVVMDDALTPVEQDLAIGSDPTFELTISPDTPTAVGIPAPIEGGTVGDVIPAGMSGVVWHFDADANAWSLASPNDTLEPLDALVVTSDEETTVTVEFAGEPGAADMPVPASAAVEAGWNFLAPKAHVAPQDAFNGTAGIQLVLDLFEQPSSQMAPAGDFEGPFPNDDDATVDPFAGYFVFYDDDGEVGAVTYEDMTLIEAYANLQIDASPIEGTVRSSAIDLPIDDGFVAVADTPLAAIVDDAGGYHIPALPDALDQFVFATAEGYEDDGVTTTPGTADIYLQDEVLFWITALDISDDELAYDDEFTVNATIENMGNQTDTQVIGFEFGPEIGDARIDDDTYELHLEEVELAPGETVTISVEDVIGDFVVEGDQFVLVYTDDALGSIAVTVEDDSNGPDSLAPVGVMAG